MPHEVVNMNEYLLVKVIGEATGEEEPRLIDVFKAKMTETGLKLAIIQLSECSTITPNYMRDLAQIYKEVKAKNGTLRLVAANKKLVENIKLGGLDRILINKMSLRGALIDLGLVKKKEFDVNFINPFLNATQKVLKVQCFIEAKAQKPSIKKPTDPLLLGDISGIISISSEAFNGTLAVSFPEAVFIKVAANMLGEKVDKIHEGVVDLVGELANIILGQAKLELATLGYALQMALPSCVWGKDHQIKHFGGGVCVVLPFETEAGIFHIEIMTNNNIVKQGKRTGGAAAPASTPAAAPKAA
jgi:chemotaxis protein CheX